MDAVSLAPAAGAQGELSGILMIKAYLEERGETGRRRVLVPGLRPRHEPGHRRHGGFEVVTIPSDRDGNTDMAALEPPSDDGVAAMMLTLPTTLGLFDPNIGAIAEALHRHGALLYGDGANLNAFLGRARFGDMGFDVVHLNLHKTFSTPHGGGGPGAGPVCREGEAGALPARAVVEQTPFPLVLRPRRTSGAYASPIAGHAGAQHRPHRPPSTATSACSCAPTPTSAPSAPRACAPISENAVINANYVQARLRDAYNLPYDRACMHEVVFSGVRQKAKGVKTLDIAKRLIDYGFHPPTIYFPLIVDEALMIEPTESESKEALDAFCEAMLAIAREAEEEPELVRDAPPRAPLRRLDEATAARKPVLRWQAARRGRRRIDP